MQSFVIASLMCGVTIGVTEDAGMAIYFALTGLPWNHFADGLLADVGQRSISFVSGLSCSLHSEACHVMVLGAPIRVHLNFGVLQAFEGAQLHSEVRLLDRSWNSYCLGADSDGWH